MRRNVCRAGGRTETGRKTAETKAEETKTAEAKAAETKAAEIKAAGPCGPAVLLCPENSGLLLLRNVDSFVVKVIFDCIEIREYPVVKSGGNKTVAVRASAEAGSC